MTQSYTTIKFTIIESVATITLSRPDAANAMNPVMARELNLAAIECEEHQGLRAVLINAEGKLFCAGGDISEFAAAGKQVGALIREMAGDLHLAISRLTRLKAPVIAAIQGTAAGAGFSLAIAADISIAATRPSSPWPIPMAACRRMVAPLIFYQGGLGIDGLGNSC